MNSMSIATALREDMMVDFDIVDDDVTTALRASRTTGRALGDISTTRV